MSANVSGFGKTMRITLNDNLLRRGSLEEIEAVMGHEMGHYVLNHIPKDMTFFTLVALAAFGFLHWSLDWCLKRWGTKWGIRGVSDPAVLPLVVLLGSIFFFVLTPFLNTHTRTAEAEADMFGLNASRQPDGFAQAAIHLGEYRKMKPTRWRSGSSSTIPAGITAFTGQCSGRRRTCSCSKGRRRSEAKTKSSCDLEGITADKA